MMRVGLNIGETSDEFIIFFDCLHFLASTTYDETAGEIISIIFGEGHISRCNKQVHTRAKELLIRLYSFINKIVKNFDYS